MGQMKKVHDVTRVLSGKKQKIAARVKDPDGKVIVHQRKRAKIWKNQGGIERYSSFRPFCRRTLRVYQWTKICILRSSDAAKNEQL